MEDHYNNNILVALREMEKLSDSIFCCKLFESCISENEKELWESILKFIIYLSIQQHILHEGSIPDLYRKFDFNMNTYSKEIFNNAQVTILIIFIYFPSLFVSIYLSIFNCRHLVWESNVLRRK